MLKISLPGTCKAYIYLTLKIKKKKEEEEKEKRKLKNLENYDPIAFSLHDMIVQCLKWDKREEVKLTVFRYLKYMKPGKTVFGRFALDFDSRRQVSRMSFHSTFNGLKTATSNGWHKCVELGGGQMNIISFVLHASITFAEKCDSKLSPIKTFFPGIREATGKNCLKNHKSKVLISNHPLLVAS